MADVVIFDPEKVQDKATFTDSLRFSEGIDFVMVSGQIVLEEGRITRALPGKVIRHNTPVRHRPTSTGKGPSRF